MRYEFGSGSRRQNASAGVYMCPPSADLRTPMDFLIANMRNKIPANRLKTHDAIFSNRQLSWNFQFALENAIPKSGDSRVPCAKITRSTKGDFVAA